MGQATEISNVSNVSDAASKTPDTSPLASTTSPSDGGGAMGRLAVDRIMADDGGPGFTDLLRQILGPTIAEDLGLATPPPALMEVAGRVVQRIEAEDASVHSAMEPQGTAEASRVANIGRFLDQAVLDYAKAVITLLPNGAAIEKKLADKLGGASTNEVWAGVLLSAVALYLANVHVSGGHTFKMSDHLSASVKADAGSFRSFALKSVNASINYHRDKLSASLSELHYMHGANTVSATISVADLELLHQKIDQTLVQFNHTTYPDGRPPTEQFVGSIATKLGGYGFRVAGVETLAAVRANKSSPRVSSNTLSEEVVSPSFGVLGMEGFKADVTATEHFGPKHAQDVVNAKLTLPQMHGVTVTIGEAIPIGPGTGKRQLSADFTWKGMKLTISQGAIPQTPGFGSISENIGAAGHGWHVGLTLPIR